MPTLSRVFISLPLIAALGVIAGWLAHGTPTPWNLGWRVCLPLLALLPLWADVLMQMWAVEDGRRTWRNFPATCYVAMALLITLYSLGFVDPTQVLDQPRVRGPLPTTCTPEGVQMINASVDVSQFNLKYSLVSPFVPAVSVYTSYSECWDCKPRRIFYKVFPTECANLTGAFYIPTRHYLTEFQVHINSTEQGGESYVHTVQDVTVGDQGVYQLSVSGDFNSHNITVSLETLEDPWFAEGPFVAVMILVVVLQCIYSFGNTVASLMLDEEAGFGEAIGIALSQLIRQADDDDDRRDLIVETEPEPLRPKRIIALDVLRGISLVVMNCANYGGMGYWFLLHTVWDGLTIADLVFPWFIWIMGVAMAVTLEGKRVKENRGSALIHVVRRSALLGVVGILLSSENVASFALIRVSGVLQRFAVSYFVVSLTILYVPKTYGPCVTQEEAYHNVQETSFHMSHPLSSKEFALKWLRPTLAELPVFFGLVGAWLGITFGAKYTKDGVDCTGYLGPGGISQQGSHFPCTGGVANLLDTKFFSNHRWGGCFPCDVYMEYDMRSGSCTTTPHHDPEGLLGALNSIALCWLGLVAGRVVVSSGGRSENRKHVMTSLALLSFLMCLVAAVLCGFRQFGGPIPVNKNLWSTSFIALMAGTGSLFLLLLLYVVDYRKLWGGKPFLFVGMNSILYYCMHEVMNYYVPLNPPADAVQTHASLTISNICGIGTNVIVVYWLYRNGLFLKI